MRAVLKTHLLFKIACILIFLYSWKNKVHHFVELHWKINNTESILLAHRWLLPTLYLCFDSTAYTNYANIGFPNRSHLNVINRNHGTWCYSKSPSLSLGSSSKIWKEWDKRRVSTMKSDASPWINIVSRIELEFIHKS